MNMSSDPKMFVRTPLEKSVRRDAVAARAAPARMSARRDASAVDLLTAATYVRSSAGAPQKTINSSQMIAKSVDGPEVNLQAVDLLGLLRRPLVPHVPPERHDARART